MNNLNFLSNSSINHIEWISNQIFFPTNNRWWIAKYENIITDDKILSEIIQTWIERDMLSVKALYLYPISITIIKEIKIDKGLILNSHFNFGREDILRAIKFIEELDKIKPIDKKYLENYKWEWAYIN